MSVDTRTPRTPDPSGRRPGDTQGRGPSGFFDDEPVLSTVRVPSDPAEVVVTHASFRVELTPPASRLTTSATTTATTAATTTARSQQGAPLESTGQRPVVSGMTQPAGAAGAPSRHRGPVVWGGRTDPADSGATELLQPGSPGVGVDGAEPVSATTQVLPRIVEGTGPSGFQVRPEGPDGPGGGPAGSPTVVGQRGPRSPESTQPQRLLHGVRPAQGAFDAPGAGQYDDQLHARGRFGHEDSEYEQFEYAGFEDGDPDGAVHGGVRRQAYYPGRRMNLGVVLLPMRIFLGFISIYAGMGKLCDPVYFDGGERGSMVTWLRSLDPWTIASPLYDFAVAHPVGSGLTVAFVQIIVGVLTVCGLWQRVAASAGVLLSAALLMTVSWASGPAYEAPDIIYLAAWSPLVIAGAPVYSIDGRLATDAWRKLGPRADLWELRRRVLRRGTVIAAVVTGVALLTGSMLGGAVRTSQTTQVPEPGEPPTNQVPGSPLPKEPGDSTDSGLPTHGQGSRGPDSHRSGGPSASSSPGDRRQDGPSTPSQRETVQAPQQTVPGAQPPQQSEPGAQATRGGSTGTSGGSGSGGSGGSNSGGTSGGSASNGGGGSSSGGSGGGLGGLLG